MRRERRRPCVRSAEEVAGFRTIDFIEALPHSHVPLDPTTWRRDVNPNVRNVQPRMSIYSFRDRVERASALTIASTPRAPTTTSSLSCRSGSAHRDDAEQLRKCPPDPMSKSTARAPECRDGSDRSAS